MITGIALRSYYSIQHAQSAAYFSRKSTMLEESLPDEQCQEAVALKGYVSATLFSSVAFLEALSNELLADAALDGGGHLARLDERSRMLIAELGETESVQKAPLLSKFALILRAAGKDDIEKGCSPGSDTATLIKLRNEIVHYKASFFDVGTEGMIRAGSFHTSKLPQQIRGLFPHRRSTTGALSSDSWMGCGCAQWAVLSAVSYADTVFGHLGVDPYYNHVRLALSPV